MGTEIEKTQKKLAIPTMAMASSSSTKAIFSSPMIASSPSSQKYPLFSHSSTPPETSAFNHPGRDLNYPRPTILVSEKLIFMLFQLRKTAHLFHSYPKVTHGPF
jgi:hypothetical protein